MKTLQDYISLIRAHRDSISSDFAVKTLRVFGSVSRNEQHDGSDLDVCVETETPNPFVLMDLKEYLERIVGCPVDVVRMRKGMSPLMRSRIDKEGVYAIR